MKRHITSYAQNFEDVMLWRALGHVSDGRYVDVGAQSAIVDSVSKAFHEMGWKGVHVEPMSSYAQQLREDRPGDVVIQALLGKTPGSMAFFEVPETGLSTFREDLAQQYERDGREVRRSLAPVMTLDDVLAVTGPEVHWLKIDVEGAEALVIEGWRGPARPWILVIESTLPMSQVQSYDAWEPAVLSKGYEFAFFDGLNRFYVSKEHAELKEAFAAGPNVFDRFELADSASSTFTDGLRRRMAGLRDEIGQLRVENQQLGACKTEVDTLKAAVNAARESLAQKDVEHLDKLHRLRIESMERESLLVAERSWAMNYANQMQEDLAALRGSMEQTIEAAVRAPRVERDLAKAEVERMRAELTAVYSSTSWILTAPLRGSVRLLRGLLRLPVRALRYLDRTSRILVMRGVFSILSGADRFPRLRARGKALLALMPSPVMNRVRAWQLHLQRTRGQVPTNAAGIVASVPAPRLSYATGEVPAGMSEAAREAIVRLRAATPGVRR
jgi:FkbM family methyltransferase